LATQAARLHARPLDRGRPLWKLYLIHGLQGGRFAKYTSATYTLAMYTSAPYTSAPHTSATYRKVHPAAIDGVDRVVDELAVSQKMQAGG
jgi:hypothetical protein